MCFLKPPDGIAGCGEGCAGNTLSSCVWNYYKPLRRIFQTCFVSGVSSEFFFPQHGKSKTAKKNIVQVVERKRKIRFRSRNLSIAKFGLSCVIINRFLLKVWPSVSYYDSANFLLHCSYYASNGIACASGSIALSSYISRTNLDMKMNLRTRYNIVNDNWKWSTGGVEMENQTESWAWF